MEIFTLRDSQPYDILSQVTDYSSFIWTERYTQMGDFELKSSKIRETQDALPTETLAGIIKSDQVMIIDNHTISRNDSGIEEIVVRGHSGERIMKDRSARRTGDAGNTNWVINSLTPSEAMGEVFYEAAGIGRYSQDAFPFLMWQSNVFDGETVHAFVVEDREAYTVMRKIADTGPLGLKMVRLGYTEPDTGAGYLLLVYRGYDLTDDIVLDVDQNVFNGPKYTKDTSTFKNIAYVYTTVSEGQVVVPLPGVSVNISGLKRRVLYVDGTDITITAQPARLNAVKQRGLQSLMQYNKTQFFDGELNRALSQYEYGNDYNLGDLVRVKSKRYGFDQTWRVEEFIRMRDESGYREYPTFTVVG